MAAIKFRGLNAVTNFETSRYDVRSIMESRSLPIGAAKRLKEKADVAALHVPRVDETDPYGWAHLGGGGVGGGQPLTMYPSYQRMWFKQEQDSSSSSVSSDHIHHQLQLGQNQGFMHSSMLQLNNLSGLDPQPGPAPNLVAYDNNNFNNAAAAACDGFGYDGVFGLGDNNGNYNRNLYYQQLPSNDPPTFTMWNGT